MTEPTTAEPAAEPEGTEPAEQAEPEGRGGNAEAARYRTQLRAAEAERDTLAARVDALHRSAVERLVADRLAAPADLFDVGQADLADLLDDDGNLDAAAVDQHVADLLATRPGLARDAGPRRLDLGQGVRGSTPGGASWSDLLRAGR